MAKPLIKIEDLGPGINPEHSRARPLFEAVHSLGLAARQAAMDGVVASDKVAEHYGLPKDLARRICDPNTYVDTGQHHPWLTYWDPGLATAWAGGHGPLLGFMQTATYAASILERRLKPASLGKRLGSPEITVRRALNIGIHLWLGSIVVAPELSLERRQEVAASLLAAGLPTGPDSRPVRAYVDNTDGGRKHAREVLEGCAGMGYEGSQPNRPSVGLKTTSTLAYTASLGTVRKTAVSICD